MTEHRSNKQAPAASNNSGRKKHPQPGKQKKNADFASVNRILIILAMVFAVALCVVIVVKIREDVGAEQNAQTLLEAYKEQEKVSSVVTMPEVQEQQTPVPTETPVPTAEPTLDPNAVTLSAAEVTPAPTATPSAETLEQTAQFAEEGDANRYDAGNDENVDETADYVAPDDPDTDDAAALIQQILESVGEDGVIGTIRIPKTDQEYPIIGKWSYKLLKISICRYTGPNVNENGNLVLIGHNYKSGAHFGNLKTLSVGDEIYLTARGSDLAVRYEIYNIVDIESDNFAAVKEYKGDSGLTLLTCTAGGQQRKLFRCIRKAATSDVDSIATLHGSVYTG